MKLGRTALSNTDKFLLALVRQYPMVPVPAMVWARYPGSTQIEKKTVTFRRALRRLQRLGYVQQCGPSGGWIATTSRRTNRDRN